MIQHVIGYKNKKWNIYYDREKNFKNIINNVEGQRSGTAAI